MNDIPDQNEHDDFDADEAETDYDPGYDIQEYESEDDDTDSDGKSFFQKNASLIIFGGIGAVFLIVGYLNFKDVLFPPAPQSLPAADITASQQAAPPAATPDQQPAPADQAAAPVTTETAPPAAPEAQAFDNAIPPADTSAQTATPEVLPPFAADQAAPMPAPQQNTAAPEAPAPAASPAPDAITSAPIPASPPPAALETAPPLPAAIPAETQTQLALLQTENDTLKQMNSEKDQTIQGLQEQLATTQAALAEAQDAARKKPVASAQPETESSPAEEQPARKPAAPAKRKTASAPRAPASAVSRRYEIRSVNDNAAWVAAPGSSELRRVTIGDTLPGIGRITAIREQNGRWVVQGTSGQLR